MTDDIRQASLGDRVALVRLVGDLRGRDEAERYMEALGLNLADIAEPAEIRDSIDKPQGYDAEGLACLRTLLASSWSQGITIRTEIDKAAIAPADSSKHTYPGNFGIAVRPNGEEGIAIATRGNIVDLYDETKWRGGQHVAALLRLEGARRIERVRFLKHMTLPAILVPLEALRRA